MKKLLWLSGLALLPLIQPVQALALASASNASLEAMEPGSIGTLTGSTTMSSTATSSAAMGSTETFLASVSVACPAISVLPQSYPEDGISLVTAFAPTDIAPLPEQSCHSQMDEVSRQLFIAVLTQTERLTDPSYRARALMHLADTYKTYGLPQALLLLDYALGQEEAIANEQLRLTLMTDSAQLYAAFSPEEQRSTREQKAMGMAAKLIIQLRFNDGGKLQAEDSDNGSGEMPRVIADSNRIYQVAHWYLNQGELDKARAIMSHVSSNAQRQSYGEQIEEDYANHLEAQGKLAAANRHRRQHLSPERQAPYAEAAAYEQMIALTEALPDSGEIIDLEMVEQLQKNVDRLQVDWAKYTYGQMVARQLILSEQYDAALDTLHQAPLPKNTAPSSSEDLYTDASMELSNRLEEQAAEETSQPPKYFGVSPRDLTPAILAIDLASEGHGDAALAFIEHLSPENPTRELQRAIVLSTVAVFQSPPAGTAEIDPGQAYLAEAIALTEQLSNSTQQAELWFLISMAQQWRNDSPAAEVSMDRAIAIAPELEEINQEILTELEGEPWLFKQPEDSPGEYSRIQDFYQAIAKDDLKAAEAMLTDVTEPYVKVSLQATLAAAFSKIEQPQKTQALLAELFGLTESQNLTETFQSEANLFQAIVSHYATAQGRITPLKQMLTSSLDDPEQAAELLGIALHRYSYSDNTEVPLAELLLLRDEILQRPEPEEQAYLFKGLLKDIARKGALSETIALIQFFPPEEQPLATVAIADVYGERNSPLAEEMRAQLIDQIKTQLITLEP